MRVHLRFTRAALASVTLVALAGCPEDPVPTPRTDGGRLDVPVVNPDAGADWAQGLVSLRVEPPMATLEGSPMATTQQQFQVVGTYRDGRALDLTNVVSYELSPATIGMIERGLFTTSRIAGGQSTLTVRTGRVATTVMPATAQITVRWRASTTVDGAPADAAARFMAGTMDMAAAPRVVYPYDNTLFPPNISNLEVQWTPPGGGADVYDVAFTNAFTDVHVYTRCTTVGTGCGLRMTPMAWRWIADTNRGVNAPLELRVRALTASGRVGASGVANLRFAPDPIEGGIYYWTASGMANGIYRYDFVRGDTAPQAFYTQPDTPRNSVGEEHSCTGCHALSLDGTRLATVLGGAHVGDVVQLDVGARRVVASKIERWAQFLSFSPDGARLMAGRDGALRTISAATLDDMAPVNTGGLATHPDWSPANNGVAFSQPQAQNNNINIRRASIAWLPVMGAGFGAPQTLVPAVMGENRFYPSATPDGRFVVFNRSVCPGGNESDGACDSYDDPSARLWVVDTTLANHTAVELVNANARGPTDERDELTNSWPRVSPFTTVVGGRRVYWVTFSSKRNYGVRLVGQERPQLWMVAVALPNEEVMSPLTGDPSFAPFWLPFQDIDGNNHIAQWTRSIVPIGAPGIPDGFVGP